MFFFALACEMVFTKTHSTEGRCEIGPEKENNNNHIQFAGASVHLSARKCLQALAVKGLMPEMLDTCLDSQTLGVYLSMRIRKDDPLLWLLVYGGLVKSWLGGM